MANIKKVVIKNQDLPLVQSDDISLYYALRYRIISEDRNRPSHWSPIYRVDFPSNSEAQTSATTTLPYTATDKIHLKEIGGGGGEKTLLISWSHPETYYSKLEEIFNSTNIFDIYLRWSTTENATDSSTWTTWTYVSKISSDTFSILKPNSLYKTLDFEVQVPNATTTRDTRLTLFKLRNAV